MCICAADIVNGHDVLMVQTGDHLSFFKIGLGITRQKVPMRQLDSNLSLQLLIFGQP